MSNNFDNDEKKENEQEVAMDNNIDYWMDNKKQPQKTLHTTQQRIDAVYNNIPYKKEKLPPNKTQITTAIRSYQDWNKFFQLKTLPSEHDWLTSFPKEKRGQTFNSWYKYCKKTKLYSILTNPNKNSIGLITCGSFNIYVTKQLYPLFDILSQITKIYFFGINIDIINSISSKNIISRYNASSHNKQLQTTSIEKQLKKVKYKHKNLCCLMGISIIDLYPDESWNFVFGEASINDMVGIFSFARYFPGFYDLMQLRFKKQTKRNTNKEHINKLKNLKKMIDGEIEIDDKYWLNNVLNEEEQILFIRRCIGVLVHEIGHLFGLSHCPYFECCMNGANHLIESDNAPLYLCPVCLHKLYFATKIMEKAQNKKLIIQKRNKKNNVGEKRYLDILTRYQQLSVLYNKYGLCEEGKWCMKRSQFIMGNVMGKKKENMNQNEKKKDE
eukprot:529108_1